jgi:hypothetical protein
VPERSHQQARCTWLQHLQQLAEPATSATAVANHIHNFCFIFNRPDKQLWQQSILHIQIHDAHWDTSIYPMISSDQTDNAVARRSMVLELQ